MSERVFTADIVVMAQGHLLLIQRRKEPYAGMWALPGGKQKEGEHLAETAARELFEETGIGVLAEWLSGIGMFDTRGRDPRGEYVSMAFLLHLDEMPDIRAGDDAASAQWFPCSDLPDLAFDHEEIVERAFLEVAW